MVKLGRYRAWRCTPPTLDRLLEVPRFARQVFVL
jgi:hypothetical protein